MERAADIRSMKTHNSISKDEIIQSHNVLYDKLSALQADNERLAQWVNDLQTGMYVNCVYCGHRYGPRGKTPVSMADMLKKHIEICPKHPMSLLKAEHERDYAAMRRIQGEFIRVDQELHAIQADIDAGKLVRFSDSKPEIVCLCGSTRFYQTFDEQNFRLTLEGKIVLTVGCNTKSDKSLSLTKEDKIRLDELHKRKIDLADRVLVLNVGGYIGESTRSEIAYAIANGKPVDYLEPIDVAFESDPHA